MPSIQFLSFTFFVGVGAGAAGLWILQNGWGKALAYMHQSEAQAKAVYSQVESQIAVGLKPVNDAVAKLTADVAAIKAKVGA